MHAIMPSSKQFFYVHAKKAEKQDLTNLGHPGGSEIFNESSLINKIQQKLFQGKRCITALPNAVHNFTKTLKNLPLNLHITAFPDNIPQP